MKHRTSRWRVVATVASATACLVAAGCSDNDSPENPDSISVEPLSGVESPATSTLPSGSVVASPTGLHSTTFDESTRSVLALDDDATSVLIFDADDLAAAPRTVVLPGAAADIVPTGDGAVLLPMQDELGRLDVRNAEVSTTKVDGDLISAAVLAGGEVAVGDAGGSIHIIDSNSDSSRTISGLSSVDSLASTEHGLAALDRRQTSLTQIDLDGESLGLALRAGTGAAELTTDRYGRILVTDAAGGELLVYSSDDLLLRQRFPIGSQPWGIAYDDRSDVVWVTTPGSNEVVGYTLDTGIPVETRRFSTVKQPDSITVDRDTGVVYVGSADGEGLQRIPSGND